MNNSARSRGATVELTCPDWIVARFDTSMDIFDPEFLKEFGDVSSILKAHHQAQLLGRRVASIPIKEYQRIGGEKMPPTVHGRIEWQPSILLDIQCATYYGRTVDMFAMLWIHPNLAPSDSGTAETLARLAPKYSSDQRRTIRVREFLRTLDEVEIRFREGTLQIYSR